MSNTVRFDMTNYPSAMRHGRVANANLDIEDIRIPYLEFLSTWNFSFLSAEIRTFFLLFTRGKIITNNQRRHWQPVNPLCRICLANNVQNPQPETIEHIFFKCTACVRISQRYFAMFHPDLAEPKQFLSMGVKNNDLKMFLNIEILLFCAYVMNTLKTSAKPTMSGLKNMMSTHRANMVNNSKKYRTWLSTAITTYGNDFQKFCD